MTVNANLKDANIVGIALLILIAFVASWAATIFVYWLITLCFGIVWTLAHATGVWLVLMLLSVAAGNTGIKLNFGE